VDAQDVPLPAGWRFISLPLKPAVPGPGPATVRRQGLIFFAFIGSDAPYAIANDVHVNYFSELNQSGLRVPAIRRVFFCCRGLYPMERSEVRVMPPAAQPYRTYPEEPNDPEIRVRARDPSKPGRRITDYAHAPVFRAGLLHPCYWPTWIGVGLLRASLWLPRRWLDGLGAVLGDLMRRNNRKRREIARTNLELCFPALTAAERDEIVRKHFRVYAQSLLDYALLWWGKPDHLRRLFRIVGLEHYDAQRAAGRPVVFLTGHFVALEIGAVALTMDQPQVGLIKPVKNPVIDWFMSRGRSRFQGRLFQRSASLLPLVRAIKGGAGFYYLPDEDQGLQKSMFAPFFATQAAKITGASRLIAQCRAAALPTSVRRLPGSRGYEIVIRPALDAFPSSDPHADIVVMNRALEQGILDDVAQYMWTFKLFRTQPHGKPSPYVATAVTT